ncbi:MAG TPA: adenosylmethionine decarboxylase [Planctomycetota bacterium]|nr:adenosylmethionine decarboxylase [Planctomycetota bacterium]
MDAHLSKPHVLIDLYGCSAARLNDLDGLRAALYASARALGCTTIGDIFHQFSPWGVTGVLAIAESHISVHTWVEDGYAAIDLFLCNAKLRKQDLDAAVDSFAAFLQAERCESRIVPRGAAPAGCLRSVATPG